MLLAGMCARRRTYLSLLRQRKVGQRKTTLLSVSLRYGQPAMLGTARRAPAIRAIAALRGKPGSGRLRGVPQNSLRATRFVQTTAANQSTQACALRRACSPRKRPTPGAATGGEQPDTGHRCARPGAARREAPAPLGAERSDGPYHGCPSGRAEKRRARGGLAPQDASLRDLTCRSCLSAAPQARSEFCGTPRARASQVARSEAKGHGQ